MNKKILISLLILFLITFCTISFATNAGEEIKDSVEKTDSTMENLGNNVKDAAEDVGNGIMDAVNSVGQGTRGVVEDVGNEVQDMFDTNNDNYDAMQGGLSTGTDTGYTATRTNADVGNSGMSNTAWIWLILGITGIVIVSLTWYYVTQDDVKH